MKQRNRPAAAVFAILLLCSGCAAKNTATTTEPAASNAAKVPEAVQNTEAETPSGGEIFELPVGGWESGGYWRIDRDGNELPPKAEEQNEYESHELIDLLTDEPRYEVRIQSELVDTEYGPAFQSLRSLWSLDGKMLVDWDKLIYGEAFGDYVLREYNDGIGTPYYYDDELPAKYHCELYNTVTGKTEFSGAASAGVLENGNIALFGRKGVPLGIITPEGEVVSGFPTPKEYYGAGVKGNYITASDTDPTASFATKRQMHYLLDADWNELLEYENINANFYRLRGDWLMFSGGGREGIYSLDEKAEVFAVDGMTIEYFDGMRAIAQTGSYRGGEPISAGLYTLQNEALAAGFLWLIPADGDEDENPAERFIGLKDGRAVLIDRDGKELAASGPLEGAKNVNFLCEGLYTCYTESEDGSSYGEGLLGSGLEIIIPAGKYGSFNIENIDWQTAKRPTAEEALISATRLYNDDRPGLSLNRYDLLDHTGNVIIDNVTAVYGWGEDRLAIERGFSIGLIDFNGEWIAKRSIFSNSFID